MKSKAVAVVLLLLVAIVCSGDAAEIYVWDNDAGPGYEFQDPESGMMVGTEYAVKRALEANGYSYDTGLSLPGHPEEYDVIFVTMGWYC